MNPVLRRELLQLMRTRKALALQLCLALGCALLVLLRWPSGGLSDLNGARSLEVLRIFGYGLLAGVMLLVPAFPATSIVREKNGGTLALLLNAPLRPWRIYTGKLLAVLGYTAVLMAMTLTAAAACHALGGTGIQGGVALLYAVLGVAAVQLAALGLLVSSRSNTSDGALRTTYALMLAVCVLPLVPYALLRGGADELTQPAAWFRCLSPIPAVMEVLGQADVGAQGMAAQGREVFARYVAIAAGFSVVCALLTLRRLNHKLLDRARASGVMTQDRSLPARLVRRLLFLVDPQRRSGCVTLWANPVMVKEFRTRRFGRSHWTLRLIAVCAILSLGLSYLAAAGAMGWGVELIGGALVLLQVTLLILFIPSLAAGMVSAERESGSWQLLRMTPLRAGRILRGKLYSVVWPVLLLLCSTLPGYVVMTTVRPETAHQVGRVIACLVLTAALAVVVSAAASTLFRSTAAAATAAYLTLLSVCLGPLLVWLWRDAPFGHATVEAALRLDPVAAALQASEMPAFARYELIPANWWIVGSVCLALLAFTGARVWQLYQPD